jgi:hypothetical protein
MSDNHNLLRAYRDALIAITRYKHTPRAYRHTKFEDLIKIAQEALKER